MEVNRQKIVLVEDEDDIAEVISSNLTREGYSLLRTSRGDEAINLIRNESPDLVLLDLMLPGIDGLSICRQVKSDPITSNTAIIILSAKGEESDIVIGLELGADDYLTKPFSPRELLARVKAVTKRVGKKIIQAKSKISIHGVTIDSIKHEVIYNGKTVDLTGTEFKILHQLASQPGRAFSREQLLNRVVGQGVVVVDRNIDVHIRSIRKKLGGDSVLIQTVRGVGYRFVDGTGFSTP